MMMGNNKEMNKVKKVIFGLSLLCLLIFASAGSGEIVDRIVAIVNDDAITLSELEEEVAPLAHELLVARSDPEEKRRILFKLRQDILERMIERKLANQESKRLGISVSELEIDRRIERIKSQNFFTDDELRQALATQGFTLEEYRVRVKDQILRYKIINQEVKSKVAITETEIQHYIEENRDLYGGERKFHLRSILV